LLAQEDKSVSNPCFSRLIGGAIFCVMAGCAWAGGGIKHPSDYGSPPITLSPCSSPVTPQDGVSADCFFNLTTGSAGIGDYLFTLFSPSPSKSITSVTFADLAALDAANVDGPFGLIEGTSLDPCSGMNVGCFPDSTTPLPTVSTSDNKTFTFTNFTGNLSGKVTLYFSFCDSGTTDCALPDQPTLTGATTSTLTGTPEPSEIGLLAGVLGLLFAIVQRRRVKQNA